MAFLLHSKFEVFVTFGASVWLDIAMRPGVLSYFADVSVGILAVSTLYWGGIMKQ